MEIFKSIFRLGLLGGLLAVVACSAEPEEVIVEKEVIKEVEVPVEKEVVKWKTRVVQVPLYSTQPGMVDLDPEILSKTSMENSNLTPKKKDDKDDE